MPLRPFPERHEHQPLPIRRWMREPVLPFIARDPHRIPLPVRRDPVHIPTLRPLPVEVDPLPIRRVVWTIVIPRIPRQPLLFSALRRDPVQIEVRSEVHSIAPRRVRQPLPIRRPAMKVTRRLLRHQPPAGPVRLRHIDLRTPRRTPRRHRIPLPIRRDPMIVVHSRHFAQIHQRRLRPPALARQPVQLAPAIDQQVLPIR